jgi:hypothetical protein
MRSGCRGEAAGCWSPTKWQAWSEGETRDLRQCILAARKARRGLGFAARSRVAGRLRGESGLLARQVRGELGGRQ